MLYYLVLFALTCISTLHVPGSTPAKGKNQKAFNKAETGRHTGGEATKAKVQNGQTAEGRSKLWSN